MQMQMQMTLSPLFISTTHLAATEVDAVAAYKSTSSEGLEPCLKLLQQAARDKSVKPELVEGALAYLEESHGVCLLCELYTVGVVWCWSSSCCVSHETTADTLATRPTPPPPSTPSHIRPPPQPSPQLALMAPGGWCSAQPPAAGSCSTSLCRKTL